MTDPQLSAEQVKRGAQVLDGDTLIGIVLKSTFTFTPEDETAADLGLATYEMSGAGYDRLTATARVERIDGEWKLFLDDVTTTDLSASGDRAGIYWVTDEAVDADALTVVYADDPGGPVNPYEPTWDSGIVAFPIESMNARLSAVEALAAAAVRTVNHDGPDGDGNVDVAGGGGGGGLACAFDPARVSSPGRNRFQTWPEVAEFMASTDLPVTVYVEGDPADLVDVNGTMVRAARVTAGTYALGELVTFADHEHDWFLGGTVLVFEDGAVFDPAPSVIEVRGGLLLLQDGAEPVCEGDAVSGGFIVYSGGTVASNDAPFFHNTGADTSFTVGLINRGGRYLNGPSDDSTIDLPISAGSAPIVTAEGALVVLVADLGITNFTDDLLAGDGSAVYIVNTTAAQQATAPAHADFTDGFGGGAKLTNTRSANTGYNPTVSGLTATNVQAAIDEIVAGGSGGGGSVAADAIFDAKGDLAVGTGANTAAKLTVGANGTLLMAASGETVGAKWASPSDVRAALGLVPGTDVQAYDPDLAAFAGLSLVADRLPYANGTGTLALATFTAAGRALVDDATAADQRDTLGLGGLATYTGQAAWAPSVTNGAVAETIPPWAASGNQAILTSGRLYLTPIFLTAGMVVSNIGWLSGSTAAIAPTNQWFGLFDISRNALRLTVDDTTTAWANSTAKTLALTSSYTVTTTGSYYLGIMVAAGTVISMRGAAGPAAGAYVAVNSSTGQTTPPTLPFTGSTGTASFTAAYGWVS